MFMHLMVVDYYFSAFCIDGIGKGGHGAWRYLVIELGYILLAHICLTIHTYLIF